MTKFFDSLATQNYRSETAEALRARLVKYQDRLFTFIKYDGVPWNNIMPRMLSGVLATIERIQQVA